MHGGGGLKPNYHRRMPGDLGFTPASSADDRRPVVPMENRMMQQGQPPVPGMMPPGMQQGQGMPEGAMQRPPPPSQGQPDKK